MRYTFICLALLWSHSAKAVVIDDFLCSLHVYGESAVPITINFPVSITREPIYNAKFNMTRGEARMSTLVQFPTGEDFEITYIHRYYHAALPKEGASQYAWQAMATMLEVNDYDSSFIVPDDPKSWPQVKLGDFPEYNAHDRSVYRLKARGVDGNYVVTAECSLLGSRVYQDTQGEIFR